MKDRKREPWRIIVGILSIMYIVFMWVRKDILAIYGTMPKEDMLPVIATSVAVTLVKVAVIAIVILLLKKVLKKK